MSSCTSQASIKNYKYFQTVLYKTMELLDKWETLKIRHPKCFALIITRCW